MDVERSVTDGRKIAIHYVDEVKNSVKVSYETLLKNVNKIGNIFLEKGLQKGDKILVMVPRVIEAYEVYLAALKTGIIIVPSSEMLTTADIQYRITHGEVTGVVSYSDFVDVYKGVEQYEQLIKFTIGKEREV